MSQPRLLSANEAAVMETLIAQQDESKDERYYLEEYFEKLPALNGDIDLPAGGTGTPSTANFDAYTVANKQFEVLGTSAVTADVTFNTTNAGILLSTHGANADQTIVTPHLDTNQTAWANVKWGSENQTEWTAQLKTGAAITTMQIWAGLKLTNTPVIATDADQVFFRYNTTDDTAFWTVISSIANTDTKTITTVAIAANTQYKLQIKIDYARVARCYINDVLVYTTAALTNDKDFIPYVGVGALDTAACTAILNYEKINRILFE